MTDSFGIGDENFEDSALVASRWTTGGNSAAARRARVKAQRRDRYGRWAEMGGGVSFPGRMADGSIKTVIGRYVGPSAREGYMRVEVTDPKSGVKLGVYDVNGRVATVSKAILSGEQLEKAGVKLDVNGNRVGDVLDKDIEAFDKMFDGDKPDDVEQHLLDKGVDSEEADVLEKARLNAEPHVSYNVVDENGNPIADAGKKAPATPADAPEQVTKNPSEMMTLFNREDGSIHPIQVVAIGGGKGWQVVKFNPDNGGRDVLATHADRASAEDDAYARITGANAKARIEPKPEPEQEVFRLPKPEPKVETPAKEPLSEVTKAQNQATADLFPTRENSIDRGQLTPEQTKALNNLVKYKEEAVSSLRATALTKGPEEYKTQYAIVQRISDAINNLADNAALGKAGDAFFFKGDQEARMENMRIIPSSVKTEIASDPKLPPNTPVITEAKAILISKTGKPYVISWKDGRGGEVYPVVDGKIDSQRAGYLSYGNSMLRGGTYVENREPHKPADASIGMIEVYNGYKEEGLGGYLVMTARWVAQSHGRRFAHSVHLLPPGNVYSKKVSKNLEDHNRTQREKAMVVQAPDSPIVKAMRAASTELGYSGTFWYDEREVIRHHVKSFGNEGAIWSNIGLKVNSIADQFRARFHGDNNAQPSVDYPAIFERHVTSENPDWTDHDITMQVLRTSYQGGMSKDEILAKLDDYIALGEDQPWGLKLDASTVRKLNALKTGLANADWDNYNPVPEPRGLEEARVKFWDSPFAGQQKFTGFVVPKGITPVRVGPDYIHRPDGMAPSGSPADWTENPSSLATKFSADELVAGLRSAILVKSNNVALKFDGNQEGIVNSAAVYRALTEQGQDAPKILAGIYDEALGEGRTDNIDALNAHRANLRDVNDDFAKILNQYGINRPAPFGEIKGNFSPTSNTLFADRVRRIPADEEAKTNIRLSPLRATNEERMLPDGSTISKNKYQPTKSPDEWVVNGVTDNPKIIAYNFSPEALSNALSNAVVNGRKHVNVQFANNQTVNMPIEAIRDALQHQGVDTEQIFDRHSQYFREMPGRLDKFPGGLWGKLDQDGNKVYEMVINANVDKTATGKFANGITDINADGFSYTLTRSINGVSTPLVKIQKNANGKYDVWYQQDFNGPATMTFDDGKVALGNVSNALTADKVFSSTIGHIEELTGNWNGASTILRNKKVISVNDEQSPADRPDLAYRVTYEYGGAEQLLPQNKSSIVLEANSGEDEFKFISRGDVTASSVKKVGDFYEVRDYQQNLVATYNNAEDALKHADMKAAQAIGLEKLLGDQNKTVSDFNNEVSLTRDRDLGKLVVGTGRDTIAIPRPDADGGQRREAVARFENASNRELQVVGYTNNQRAGVYRAGSRFEFLSLNFYNKEENPGADRKPIISAKVVRTGRSEWSAQVKFEDGRTLNKSVYSNDPLTAVDKLKEILADKKITHDNLKFEDIVPKRTTDATGNDQRNYAGRPATVVPTPVREQLAEQYARQPEDLVAAPIDVDRADKVVQRILGNAEEIGNTPANRVGRLGIGINAPVTIKLANGKKFKVKNYASGNWKNAPSDREERLNINEAAVQGLADLMGVNATPGGLAKVNGKYVIMDPIAENVDSAGWMSIFRPGEARKPENAQAIQDYKNAVVFNALVAGGDLLHHPSNFLLLKNPDGTKRLAICDGGRALIGGAYNAEPVNARWSEPVTEIITGRYHNDFMRPGARLEMLRGAPGDGLMTRDEYIQIARDKVVPLTPEVIAKMGEIYQNPDDRRNFVEGLTRRRKELLQYLGIQDNQNAANGAQEAPAAPAAPTPAPSAPNAPSVPAAPSAPRIETPPAPPQDNPLAALRIDNPRMRVLGNYSPNAKYAVFDGDDNGKLAVITKGFPAKNYYASIKTRKDGSVVAVLNPLEIGVEDRNGDAQLAIFRGPSADEDAQKWLSNKFHAYLGEQGPAKNMFAANDANKDNLPEAGQGANPAQIISKGFLNPTSDRQRMFARRLVEGKKMSDSDRQQYRDVLDMNGLTTGEVGGIIDAIKDNEDRSASEIAQSRALDHVVPANEVVNAPSDLGNASKPRGGAKRVIDLVQGDRVDAGTVVFVHDRGNGQADLGVVNPVNGDGKLIIVRGLDGNMMVTVRPESNAGNNQMVGGNNAVNNFAGRANRTLEDIKRAYPNFQTLPNGDIVIGQRDFTDAAGRKTRYEAVVHRTADETFVGYVRQLKLDRNGNIVSTKAAAFTAPAHSSVAALNRLGTLFTGDGGAGSGMNGNQPNNWFNNLQSVPEAIDPRTGQLLPTYLIPDRNARLIGNTGIETTGDGLKDALISHVANLIDRGMLKDDILQQVAGAGDENFAVLSRHQFMDIIERIEARRANPGVNSIPYVSKDKKTIVRVGDRIYHYDANGNQIMNPDGTPRIGTVIEREPLRVYQKAQGTYEYRDILTVKWDGNPRPRPIAARRLSVVQRADGSAPLPAVNEPATTPNAPEAPQAPAAPEVPQAPQNQIVADRNIEILGRAFNGRAKPDGSMTFYDESGNEAATITPQPDGTYRISEPFGGDLKAADSYDQAVIVAGRMIETNVAGGLHDESKPAEPSVPQVPSVPEAPAVPEVPEPSVPEPNPAPAENNDAALSPLNLNVRGVKMSPRRAANGSDFFTQDENGKDGAFAMVNRDGSWTVIDPANGERETVASEEQAILVAGAINFTNIRNGYHEPAPVAPAEPSAPALPNGYTSSPIGSGNDAYEVKHETDKENTPYYIVDRVGEDFVVSKWSSQNSAEAQRFRRPEGEQRFASKEEADQWIANDLGPSDGGNGGNGGGENPPSGPQGPVDINEWVGENYGDVHVDGIEENVINSYSEPTPRLVETLKMKAAFEAGFTETNARFNRGINPIRRVQLSDGTFAYLKNIENGPQEVFKELAAGRMFEAMGLDSTVITSVTDPSNGKSSILIREIPNDGIGASFNGDRRTLKNANKIALLDYLVSNGDRHNGNWLFKGDEAFPIDHGLTHSWRDVPSSLERVPDMGAFGALMSDWARGRLQNPDQQMFSQSEFMQIREKILGLKEMYESMSPEMGRYFNESIVPRLNLLLGIWS